MSVWLGPGHTSQGLPRDPHGPYLRGRKPIEFHLPHLFDDLRGLVQDHLQTDPTFQTTGLYCRLSAPEVRKQLIERVGYTDEQLPSVQTIASKLNVLGFRLRTAVCSFPEVG